MKTSHEHVGEFPREEVRSAIQAGIEHAQQGAPYDLDSESFPLKRKKLKRQFGYALCSIAAAFVILIGSAHYSPVLASSLSKLPFIGLVFGDSDLIGLHQAQKRGLTSQIGQTQTVDGIAVTLDEILYDENRITISYIIQSDKDIEKNYFGAGMDFTINGKLPSGSSGGYNEVIHSSNFHTVIQDITVTDEMPDQFELGLILHGEQGERWYFEAPIHKVTDVYNIPVHYSQHRDGMGLNVTRLSVSKVGVNVFYESMEQASDSEPSRVGDIEFRMYDQDGHEITSHSGGAQGNRIHDQWLFKGSKQFDPIRSNVTEVTIIPYIPSSSGGGVALNEQGKVIEEIIAKNASSPVQFDSFKVKIPAGSLTD